MVGRIRRTVFLVVVLHATIVCARDETCDAKKGECTTRERPKPFGKLDPQDLPSPVAYDDWTAHYNTSLPGLERQLEVREGSVPQINNVNAKDRIEAKVFALSRVLDGKTVRKMLKLLNSVTLDSDPDTVDGMPTYEVFLDSPDLQADAYEERPNLKSQLERDPEIKEERQHLRRELSKLIQPALTQIITPFVRQTFADRCKSSASRACTPCYSLFRKYKHGSRQSHATHHDGHAIVTTVTSLSDYGKDYVGGLYVATGHGHSEYLALNKGDAAVHDTTLLHGVKVHDLPDAPTKTERWSWILWFRDSTSCRDESHEWFAACSAAGNALCQQLHSTKVGNIPGIDPGEAAGMVMRLNMQAAQQGAGLAAVKVARAYLKQLASELPLDVGQAKRYFELATASFNPDGHFGLATLWVAAAGGEDQSLSPGVTLTSEQKLARAVDHLEAAAMQGHVFSMFNLGLAHVYGYGLDVVDLERGAAWLVASGLPEGYYAASHHAAATGDVTRQREYEARARELGYYHPWRVEARWNTGSGGAGGVDLNLKWPPARLRGGMQPARF